MNFPQSQTDGEEWNTTVVVALAILSTVVVAWWKLDYILAVARSVQDYTRNMVRRMWNHTRRPAVQWFVVLGGTAVMLFFLFSWRGGLVRNLDASVLYIVTLTAIVLVFSLFRFRPYKVKRMLGIARQTAPAKLLVRLRSIGQRIEEDEHVLS